MEKIAEILAEARREKSAEQQDLDVREGMLREVVKEAARLGWPKAMEQGEGRDPRCEVRCASEKAPVFVGKRWTVLWTAFGKRTDAWRY